MYAMQALLAASFFASSVACGSAQNQASTLARVGASSTANFPVPLWHSTQVDDSHELPQSLITSLCQVSFYVSPL